MDIEAPSPTKNNINNEINKIEESINNEIKLVEECLNGKELELSEKTLALISYVKNKKK